MEDKIVKCKECGEDFTITIDDQQWYASKGFHEPKRCKSCRALRRQKIIGREDIDYGKTRK